MRVAISACLLGAPVRYDGGSKPVSEVRDLAGKVDVLRVCPETASGLPVPRPPAEQRGGRVLLSDGRDVTEEFSLGAERSLDATRRSPVSLAVLKAKSPSCGVGLVYDGTYSGRLVPGDGVFAARLKKEGVCVVTEDTVRECKPSVEHPVAIVLGSGLGHLGSLVRPVRRIDYHDIDGFPLSARPVAGHRFEATVGTIDDVPVVVYPGRIHLYQGYSAAEVTALVRHAHHLGCHDIVFACATGAVPGMAHTGLGILTDQINLTGRNPLAEWDGLRDVESPFVDMNEAYSPYLRTLARGVADDLGIAVEEGVYAGVLGPCFETPAEVAALRALGVSYVGMSTVCEVIMAKALGMSVLGLTLAANESGAPAVSHESVLEAAEGHAQDFEALVRGVLHLL
ncbi:MAG TPA: purine-nucleoside phosphorylase [Candidatus Olsenella avicola]|uniref:purine-nucleoside phosphorylase n=1 Tax=Olsenella sp. An285 TaxID=1965621 RepID=UPI000B36C402|nr:purine-nucleoside phosphorylase [Olsenella sp. An285]OUO47745.1 purine-nucleoside phosphorylase [Olsenella sp. An285]HIY50332.1 purine-nucleoside phosphorylase [Candidatus Olsenella avicola]